MRSRSRTTRPTRVRREALYHLAFKNYTPSCASHLRKRVGMLIWSISLPGVLRLLKLRADCKQSFFPTMSGDKLKSDGEILPVSCNFAIRDGNSGYAGKIYRNSKNIGSIHCYWICLLSEFPR